MENSWKESIKRCFWSHQHRYIILKYLRRFYLEAITKRTEQHLPQLSMLN